jgi:hypothetical protein
MGELAARAVGRAAGLKSAPTLHPVGDGATVAGNISNLSSSRCNVRQQAMTAGTWRLPAGLRAGEVIRSSVTTPPERGL